MKEVFIMNNQRAKEIASSPVMANVTFNGARIYIESVNSNNDTAMIHFLNQSANKKEVSLNSLTEH